MLQDLTKIQAFLAHVHPYDSLTEAELAALSGRVERLEFASGETIYSLGKACAAYT